MKVSIRYSTALLISLVCLTISVPAGAEITSLADAINKAGRQRMLSQRIVKDYCLVGMDVAKGASAKELRKSTGLFESQLQELKAYTSTDQVKQQVEKVASLWGALLETIRSKPTRESCKALNEASEDLLQASHEVVQTLAEIDDTSSSEIVDISGRQRMLSQRIAKFQTMYAWDLTDAEIQDKLNQAMAEFQRAQVVLFQSKLKTPEIKELLIQVNRSYKPMKRIIWKKKDKASLAEVIKDAEMILRDMNTATGLYQKEFENQER